MRFLLLLAQFPIIKPRRNLKRKLFCQTMFYISCGFCAFVAEKGGGGLVGNENIRLKILKVNRIKSVSYNMINKNSLHWKIMKRNCFRIVKKQKMFFIALTNGFGENFVQFIFIKILES